MSDEGTLLEQVRRGNVALRELDSETLRNWFETRRKFISDSLFRSSSDEKALRDNAYTAMLLLNTLEEDLKRFVATGEAAKKELLRLKDPSRVRRLLTNVRRT